MKRSLIALTLFYCASQGLAMGTCGGPTPYKLLKGIKASFAWLDQKARDFVYWDEKEQIIIRNYFNTLNQYSIHSGFLTSLNTMDRPVSNIKDPNNDYVVAEGENSILNVQSKKWEHFRGAQNPIHLFWKNSALYTGDYYYRSDQTVTFDIFAYRPSNKKSRKVCQVKLLTPGVSLRLAEGAHYPYATLYRARRMTGSTALIVYQVNVETCDIEYANPTMTGVPGNIKKVFALEGLGNFAVQTDNQSPNLFWHRQSGCKAFDLDPNARPVVVDAKEPTLATWTPNQGLRVLSLKTAEYFELLKLWSIADLGPRDIQLSEDQDRIVLSPLLKGERFRQLLHVELQ